LEDVLRTKVDGDILAALDLLVVAAKNELVLGGNVNSELLPIRHHVKDLHLEGLADQPNPGGPASEN